MNAEGIREKLGLISFDEFEYDMLLQLGARTFRFANKQQAINERFRQTGRSTKIICQMLEDVSNGEQVIFLSHNRYSTERLRMLAKKYASDLCFNSDLILNYGSNYYDDLPHGYDAKIFRNHLLP